jgi:lipopolysaccharide transport system ATP-binding protein
MFTKDIASAWARFRGKDDPNSLVTSNSNAHDSNGPDLVWALKDINLEIKRGEILGIIGKNGAGKSTLLKIISRITSPTKGRINISGRTASLIEVGTGFHGELTGRENIYLNGSILGLRKHEINQRLDKIIDFSGVEKYIDTPVKRYSSGMYVRLGFSVAAHLDPDILIIDEVLAVGDAEFQKKCFGKMKNISSEGRTVLFVSHNMPSIINLCNRGILLNDGEVIKDGQAEDVVENYLLMGGVKGGEIVWSDLQNAPGNEIARLQSVKILQDGIEGSTSVVDIAKEVHIEIKYLNLQEGAQLCIGLWLDDGLGTAVLASENAKYVSLTEDPWWNKPHPVGLFKSICRIPGTFLNDRTYQITVYLSKYPGKLIDHIAREEHIISFSVYDSGGMRKRGIYGGWKGVVRPKLDWNTEFINSNSV